MAVKDTIIPAQSSISHKRELSLTGSAQPAEKVRRIGQNARQPPDPTHFKNNDANATIHTKLTPLSGPGQCLSSQIPDLAPNPSIKVETIDAAKPHLPPAISRFIEATLLPLTSETHVIPESPLPRYHPIFKKYPIIVDPPNIKRTAHDDATLGYINRVARSIERHSRGPGSWRPPPPQWKSFTVAPMLGLVETLLQDVRGESTVKIVDLSSEPLVGADGHAQDPGAEGPDGPAGGALDFAVGVPLAPYQSFLLKTTGRRTNPTGGYAEYVPLFLGICVGDWGSGGCGSALDRLGKWAAAQLRGSGDAEVPLIAVVVETGRWSLYVAYANGPGEVVLVGPEGIGSTAEEDGVFRVLHVLEGLARWGSKEYRDWVERKYAITEFR